MGRRIARLKTSYAGAPGGAGSLRVVSMAFLEGFLDGLGKMVVLTPPSAPKRRVDAASALRGDMERIGKDMRVVVAREKAKTEKRQPR